MKTATRRQLVIGSIGTGIVLATGLIRFINDQYRFSLIGMALIILSFQVSFHISGIQIAGWDGGHVSRLECILYMLQCVLFSVLIICQLYRAIDLVMSFVVCIATTISYVIILHVAKNVHYS